MKVNFTIYPVIVIVLILTILFSCKKEAIPSITIASVTNITSNSATSGGEITADGGAAVIARGICWSTNQNPTTTDSKTTNGTGLGSFTSSITGLNPGATYTLKAYAINAVGTAYSSPASFSTLALVPVLTTTDVSTISSSSVNSGGNVTNDGGSPVTARGVCWNTSQNPTIADSKTTDGTGSGIFTSTITGLTPGSTYYFRAYATNSIGTAYGNQVTTTTMAVLPTITTTSVSAVTSTTATSGGNITNDGGSPVTARGICWSTSQNPTITSSNTTNGTGTGNFTSSITGLTPGATYYIRAYATNSIGTAYGNQVTTTTMVVLPTIATTSVSAVTATTATSGGNITNDGGSPVTARGVCWSTSANPTITNSKTPNGSGIGIFTSSITGLTANTSYYVRAYATNSVGTAYGNEVSFTTTATVPTLTTTAAFSITQTTATSGGNITSDGGSAVTARGVCWSTLANSTIANSKTTNGSGTGTFTSSITGLTANATYYVRAYATNSVGTAYGNEVSFTTNELQLAIIDVIQETDWDYWAIAKDGSNFFVSLSNNRPVSVYVKSEINKSGFIVFCDEKGLPSKMVVESYVFLFENYRDQFVDVAVISPGGDISFQRDLKVNIDLSLFYQKSFKGNSELIFGLKLTSHAIGVASCVGGLLATSTFVGAPLGALLLTGCAATVVGLVVETLPEDFQIFGIASEAIDVITGTIGCFGGNWWDCGSAAAQIGLALKINALEKIENENVTSTEKLLIQKFVVTTNAITNFTTNSAIVSGSITIDGVTTITERGVFYGTSPNPEITGTMFLIGNGTGNFSATLSGLTPNVTYYVKAYARSSQKFEYGNQITFKTSAIQLPTLTTTAVSSVTTTSATSGGNISSAGGGTITAKGVCWSTTSNPTTSNNKTSDGTGTGNFTSSITGLNSNTTYYVRAYATNSVGTAYGTQVNFTTSAVAPVVLTLTTTAASSITSTTATSGGNISSDGGASVTARGVCWSTSQTPTTANNKTTDGTGVGIFTSSITGLTANTTYYVRAYATNSVGTAYGTQVSFTTSAVAPVVPTLTTTTASSITSTTASSGGNISSDGGAIVTDRGVCWSTTASPTTSDSKTTNGTGTGSFTSSITGLTANRLYYVRAFAVNSKGTAYGNQVSFTTASGSGGISITPSNSCSTAPVMNINTTYSVSINVNNYSLGTPITGESKDGSNIRGFWLAFKVPSNWDANHDVKIFNVSSNFDPVFGIKANCDGPYLGQRPSFLDFINATGKGGSETSDTNLPGTNGFYDDTYFIRIYHYYGNETPNISFDIKVE